MVSHDYPLVPWREDAVEVLDVPEKVAISGSSRTVLYSYTVPARVGGTWDLFLPGRSQPRPRARALATDGEGPRAT